MDELEPVEQLEAMLLKIRADVSDAVRYATKHNIHGAVLTRMLRELAQDVAVASTRAYWLNRTGS